MPFQPPEVQTPTDIPRITVTLTDRLAWDGNPATRSAHYDLVVTDQDGRKIHYPHDVGDLWPHISAQWQQTLLDFADYIRALAEDNILPP